MKYIIGGGAAGMIAAITAAEHGKKVAIIEKNNVLGKKMAITGKGRCNITNACDIEELFNNVPVNHKFLYSSFYSFTNMDTIDFFEKLGVKTKVERGKRVFPESDKAIDVINALKKRIKDLKIRVINDRAEGIIVENGEVKAVKCTENVYECSSVLIATGGLSYPNTGSTGDGYKMAKELGHSISELKPSLVPVVTAEDTSSIMGLSLKNVLVSAKNASGKTIFSDLGEMLFTHYGMSGPTILSCSSHIRDAKNCKISIDLKPGLSVEKLDARIVRDFEKYSRKDFVNSLNDLLPSKLIAFIVNLSEIPPDKKVNAITKAEREKLVNIIKNLEFTVLKFRPISEAIITSGGIKTNEINSSTMESKLIKGLFFAGEIIDVDAYTGGFNLQIAFSTGHLAALNM